jgi:peptide/nickel transport system permease protein
MALIYVFALKLGWLPSAGYVLPLDDPLGNLRYVILPGATLGAALMANLMRTGRSSLLEVLQEDFVRTARAKGLREHSVLRRHALRVAMLPVVTVLGLQVSRLFGGAVIAETLFGIPGLGRLLVDSIFARDYPVVQGVLLFVVLAVVLTSLVVDLTYGLLDPRIRYR